MENIITRSNNSQSKFQIGSQFMSFDVEFEIMGVSCGTSHFCRLQFFFSTKLIKIHVILSVRPHLQDTLIATQRKLHFEWSNLMRTIRDDMNVDSIEETS